MTTQTWRGQDGATAVLVSILMVVIFGVAAVAVDLGSAWETKRELVADTDASALAAAVELEQAGSNCTAAALDTAGAGVSPPYLQAVATLDANNDMSDGNNGTHAMIEFDVACGSGRSGNVTVGAQRDATTVFAQIFGFGPTTPASSSTAQWGDVIEMTHLRPFGVCFDPTNPTRTDPHARAWNDAYRASNGDPATYGPYIALKGSGDPYGPWNVAAQQYQSGPDGMIDYPKGGSSNVDETNGPATYNQVNYDSYGTVHRIYFNNEPPGAPTETDGCGSTNGSWGNICFVASDGCSQPIIEGYLDSGYPGAIDLGGSSEGDEDCDDEPGSGTEPCDVFTGNFLNASDQGELKTLVDDETEFAVLMYNLDVGGAMDPSGFLGVIVRGYGPVKTNGAGAGEAFTGTQQERYLDLQFVTLSVEGRIGDAGGAANGARGVGLCDADRIASQCG